MCSVITSLETMGIALAPANNRQLYGDKRDASDYAQDDPLLLLVRHNYPGARNVYGVPGGLQDPDDQTMYGNPSMRAAAGREFAEEVLGLEGEFTAGHRKEAFAQFVAMTDHDELEEFAAITTDVGGGSTHTTKLYRMHVPMASVFEERMAKWNLAVNPDARVDVKRITTLSSEMTGYVWLRKSAIVAAVNSPVLDRWGNLQVRDPTGGVLSVRNMVLGQYKQNEMPQWQNLDVHSKIFDLDTTYKTVY